MFGVEAEHGVSVTVSLSGWIKVKKWLGILETTLPSHVYNFRWLNL